MATLGNLVVGVSVDTAPLNALTTAMRSVKTSADTMNTSVKTTDTVTKSATSSTDKATTATKNLGAAHDSASRSVGGFGSQVGSMVKSIVLWNVGYEAVAGTIRGIGGAIGSTISAGVQYQDQMNTLGSVTGATKQQMQQMSDTAVALGNDIKLPNVSAADAANAMVELAKAGLSVKDTMAAASGTLELAAAGSIDTATAANITANALNAFHLQGGQAGDVADYLANTANAASAQVSDLGAALQDGGAAAALAHVPLQDFLAAVGEMTNAGVKGAMAGTDLKTMFQRLASPTQAASDQMKAMGINVYDAQGNLLPLDNIVNQFANSLKGMNGQQQQSDLETIFGSRANQAMSILANTSVQTKDGVKSAGDALDDMTDKVTKSGGAAKVAAAKSQGLGGAWRGFTNLVQTTQLTVFLKYQKQITDFVKSATKDFQTLVDLFSGKKSIGSIISDALGGSVSAKSINDQLNGVKKAFKDIGDVIGAAGKAAKPFIDAIGKIAGTFIGSHLTETIIVASVAIGVGLVLAFIALAGAAWAAATAVFAATWPFLVVIGVLALIGIAIYELVTHWGDITKFFGGVFSKVGTVAHQLLGDIGNIFSQIGGTIHNKLSDAGNAVDEFAAGIARSIHGIIDKIGGFFSDLGSAVQGTIQGFKDFLNQWWVHDILELIALPFFVAEATVKFAWGLITTDVQAAVKVIGDIFSAFGTTVHNAWSAVWTTTTDDLNAIWSVVSGWLNTVKTWIGNIFNTFGTLIHNAWSDVWKKTTDDTGSIWSVVSGWLTTVSTWIGNIFDSFGTTIHNAWSKVWHVVSDDTGSIWDIITTWGGNIEQFIRGIFNGLGDTIHTAIGNWWGTMHGDLNWIIDRVNDFINAVNNPSTDPLAALGFHLDTIPHFATGGIVPGMGGGDTQPAMLTPGEVVLNKSAVAGLGGAEMANKLNQGWGLGAGPDLGAAASLVGQIGGQCLAWVSSFLPQFRGIPAAIDLLGQINSQTAKAGEVFVMGSQVGQYGHTGFVTGTNGSNVDVLDSNWNLDGVIRAHEVPGSLISGYIDTALPGGLMGILSSIGGALDPASILNKLMNDVIGGFSGGGAFGPIPGNILKGQINNIINKAKSIVAGAVSAIAGSAPSGGGNLSVQQMAQYWSQAGGNPGLSHTMGQIGMAESSGNAAAIGPGGSWGLWQIQPQDWGFTKTTDPLTQALDAVQIEGIQGLRAWSTYNNGAYMRYDHGGDLPPGLSAVYNGTGRSETVRTAAQEDELVNELRAMKDLMAKKLLGSVTIQQTQGQSAASVIDELQFQTWATQL